MYLVMKESIKDGEETEKPTHDFNDVDECLVALDVKACVAIANNLPYDVYHIVQNCISANEMMDTLAITYEGTNEKNVVNKSNLNLWYDHFSSRIMNLSPKFSIASTIWLTICFVSTCTEL